MKNKQHHPSPPHPGRLLRVADDAPITAKTKSTELSVERVTSTDYRSTSADYSRRHGTISRGWFVGVPGVGVSKVNEPFYLGGGPFVSPVFGIPLYMYEL